MSQEQKKNLRNESTDKYAPAAEGQKRFVQKHFDSDNRPKMAPGFEGEKDRVGNNIDQVYRGGTIKSARTDRQGYPAAPSQEDEKVYEGKTWRKEGKKHAGASVRKFLQKKKQNDEKRLQGEEVEELQDEPLDEAKSAHAAYLEKHAQCKKLLKEIDGHLTDHQKRVTSSKEFVGYSKGRPQIIKKKGEADWGHVGDLGHVRGRLEELRDFLGQKGEYAVREETTINEDFTSLADVRTRMMAANKVHQLGVKHGDKQMQAAAKDKLRELAKHHARLQDAQDEEVAPEDVTAIMESLAPSFEEVMIANLGDELGSYALEAYDALDEEGQDAMCTLINDGNWEELVKILTGGE